MNKKKSLFILRDVSLLIVLLFIDQITKYLVQMKLQENKSYPIIGHFLQLFYIKNTGAAFGILKDQQLLFILIACIVLIVVTYLLVKFPLKRKFTICRFFLILITAGTIGNMIDRMLRRFVIDFIYFSGIHFPIFNVADIYVTVSTIGLIYLFLFKYKEYDLSFISFKTKKFRDIEDMEQ